MADGTPTWLEKDPVPATSVLETPFQLAAVLEASRTLLRNKQDRHPLAGAHAADLSRKEESNRQLLQLRETLRSQPEGMADLRVLLDAMDALARSVQWYKVLMQEREVLDEDLLHQVIVQEVRALVTALCRLEAVGPEGILNALVEQRGYEYINRLLAAWKQRADLVAASEETGGLHKDDLPC